MIIVERNIPSQRGMVFALVSGDKIGSCQLIANALASSRNGEGGSGGER